VNVGISVSRVGSAAQTKAMKKVAGPLKLDLAQYRELAAFAQFSGDLDKSTRDQLTRGEKLSAITRQPQYAPVAVEKQVAILYVASKGKLDDIPTPRVSEFESGFYTFLDRERPQVLAELAKEQALTDSAAKGLDDAVGGEEHSPDHARHAVRCRLQVEACTGVHARGTTVRSLH